VIEKPQWNLTIFKVRFGLLTLKAYTKGERVLRFEAIMHNTKQLGCGRTLDRFAQITTRLTATVNRFTSNRHLVGVAPAARSGSRWSPHVHARTPATRSSSVSHPTTQERPSTSATLVAGISSCSPKASRPHSTAGISGR